MEPPAAGPRPEAAGAAPPAADLGPWLLRVAGVATLLTNSYYLSFLEPLVPRALLGGLVVAAAVVSFLPLPKTRPALAALVERAAVPMLLVLVLGLGFFLREWGSRSGLPQSYPVDEIDWVNRSLQMLKRGDFNPQWWHHPTLHRYVTAATYTGVFLVGVSQGRWRQLGELTEQDLIYWGRFAGVLSGTAAIAVTFFLARRLFGTGCGLLAAALLAVLPGAVKNAPYNKPDTLTALMAVLAVLMAVEYLLVGGAGRALACGLLAGLAAAAKYNAATVFLAFLVAVLVRRGTRSLSRSDLYLGALGAVVGFLMGCPYAPADLPRFLDHVADEIYIYGLGGREGAEGVDNWRSHAAYFFAFGTGPLALLAAGAGLFHLLLRPDGSRLVFLVFPLVYSAHYSAQKIKHEATLVPLFPFLAVLAAYAGMEAVRRVGELQPRVPRHWALGIAWLLLLSPPLVRSIGYDELITRKDSGSFAREWIDATFPAGTHFAVERNCPVLDRGRYRVTMEARVINRSLDSYREEGVEYLIVTSFSYSRFNPEHRQTREYRNLFAACPLVREFLPGDGPGPTIRILKLPAAEARAPR